MVIIGKEPILFVSSETFYDVGSLNCSTQKEAIAEQIYGLDAKGKIICYGEVRSQGTAYPISMLNNNIVVGGHHFVRKYALRGEPVSLELVETGEVSFHTSKRKVVETYTYENRETDVSYEGTDNRKKFERMIKYFGEANVLTLKGNNTNEKRYNKFLNLQRNTLYSIVSINQSFS